MSSDDEEIVGGKASAFPEIRPIVPLQTEVSGLNLHPNLPDVLGGALICMVGKIKAGKSVLWNNMILSDDFFNDLFSTVVIISPTIQHDETSRFAYEKYRDSCYTQYDDAIVEAVKNIQVEKLQQKDSDTSFAIVVDDMHGEFNHGSGKKGTGLSNFATRFRHYARRHKDPCALILSSQRMKDLTPAVRTCCTNMMISSGIKNQKKDMASTLQNGFSTLQECHSAGQTTGRPPPTSAAEAKARAPPEAPRGRSKNDEKPYVFKCF